MDAIPRSGAAQPRDCGNSHEGICLLSNVPMLLLRYHAFKYCVSILSRSSGATEEVSQAVTVSAPSEYPSHSFRLAKGRAAVTSGYSHMLMFCW